MKPRLENPHSRLFARRTPLLSRTALLPVLAGGLWLAFSNSALVQAAEKETAATADKTTPAPMAQTPPEGMAMMAKDGKLKGKTPASPPTSAPGMAAQDAEGVAFFESKIRPVLIEHCYECHSAEEGKSKGGLLLDTRDGIRKGGDTGPGIVPGKPGESLLLTAISHTDPDMEEMPPKRDKLSKDIISDITAWIKMGAPDPRDATSGGAVAELPPVSIEAGRKFWAYQKPERHGLPKTSDPGWARQDIDHFVLAALEAQGMKPSPDAAPAVLLRRLHFDLVGLPPSPKALRDFLGRVEAEGLDQALEAEVDALLASKNFGERWGRHWLDVARYAESTGKESNITMPHAWRYRDYVIDSVNEDKPYDRFLTEQIAGDLLPYENKRERAEHLIATGFLAIGPKGLNEQNGFQFLADLADEQIDTVTRSVMATSVACARCHHHKFDPYSMEDYYALAGIFVSTETLYGAAIGPESNNAGGLITLPALKGQAIPNKSLGAKKVAQLKQQLADLDRKEAEGKAAVEKAIKEGKDPSGIVTLEMAIGNYWRRGGIEGQLKQVDEEGNALPLAMGVRDREKIYDAPLLERGEISSPGAKVPRGFPEVIELAGVPAPPEGKSGRLEFAKWLTHPEHPLTSRVMANRVWRHLFGEGIVRTEDNFGFNGERPTHPELLDHLALDFVGSGWSLKALVREVALSRAYRQSSDFQADYFEKDPDNVWLWRANKRRLDAEAIRDAMLAVSGDLDPARPEGSLVAQIGDKSVSLFGFDKNVPSDLDGAKHRSVYLPVVREKLPDVLDLFDFAEPSLVIGDRPTTNVPLQALYLMNGTFVQERAEALAYRVSSQRDTAPAQIRYAFQLCFNRPPDKTEMKLAMAFLEEAEAKLKVARTERDSVAPEAENTDAKGEGKEKKEEQPELQSALASYCQALLATAEFRNVD